VEETVTREKTQFEIRQTLRTPADFRFWPTVVSHGWCELPPFACDPELRELRRLLLAPGGEVFLCRVRADPGRLKIVTQARRPLSQNDRRMVLREIRTCLRMDEDFSGLYTAARTGRRHRWITAQRAGRLLRSPTVFEDAIKMICTTNCSWGLTVAMVHNIVREFGKRFEGDLYAFPRAAAIAGSTEGFLRARCRTGYRAPYILELAERVATGKLDVEAWRTSAASLPDLEREMRTVRGMGEYAVGNLLRLLGRYEHLALDSWVRAKYYELYTRGRKVDDAQIQRQYTGQWRGLLFWLDMTRHWHDQKFPSSRTSTGGKSGAKGDA
jgi:N-glycosylase/DNA lyase